MAGIASVPERERLLEQTLRSIAPQVDRVFVSLNGYTSWPGFVDELPNVFGTVRDTRNGGDAEKFADVDEWDGIVVTCDDDLVYPAGYVDALVDGLERYGGAIVGFHGGKTLGWNGKHVAATHKQIRCLGALAEDDTDVNVLGTGALAYDTRKVPVWRGVFRSPNMADVHLACHARAFGIQMVALAHPAGWIRNILPGGTTGIYEANRDGDGSARDTRARRRAELDRHDWTAAGPPRPRVRVSVATCERPDLLDDLLVDLEREAAWLDLHVAVYDDASAADYRAARARVERNGWEWHRTAERLGKQRHCDLVSMEMAGCESSAADWFVFLPDDVRLVRHAIPRAIDTWNRLDDPATLTLWRLRDHEGTPNWTGLLPVERDDGWEVFHVDGLYLCRRDTLDMLGYRCPALPRRWRAGRSSSSGVGRAMSTTLHDAGRRMYRVAASLAVPVPGVPSVMNPDVRDRRYPGVAL